MHRNDDNVEKEKDDDHGDVVDQQLNWKLAMMTLAMELWWWKTEIFPDEHWGDEEICGHNINICRKQK